MRRKEEYRIVYSGERFFPHFLHLYRGVSSYTRASLLGNLTYMPVRQHSALQIEKCVLCLRFIYIYEVSDIAGSTGILSLGGSLTSASNLSSFMSCSVCWSRCCCFLGALHGIRRFGESFRQVTHPLQAQTYNVFLEVGLDLLVVAAYHSWELSVEGEAREFVFLLRHHGLDANGLVLVDVDVEDVHFSFCCDSA